MTEAPPPPEFSVSVEETPHGGIVVSVVGELDIHAVQQLDEATLALREAGRALFFDLGGLTFIDSSGLRFFVSLHHATRRDGLAFTMSRPGYRVMRAFELTALDGVLPWADLPS